MSFCLSLKDQICVSVCVKVGILACMKVPEGSRNFPDGLWKVSETSGRITFNDNNNNRGFIFTVIRIKTTHSSLGQYYQSF